MRVQTRTVVMTALVALLLATAGCMDGGDGGDGDASIEGAPEASTLQTDAAEQMQGIDAAHMTMTMTVTNGNQSQEFVSSNGVIDTANRKMRMNSTSQMMGNQQVTQYVIDDTMYMNMQGQWVKRNVSGQFNWEQGSSQLSTQQEILENSSVSVTGEDEVNGNEVWVLSVEPDDEAMNSLMNQQNAPSGGMAENVDFSNVEITQYVDKETDHIRKTVANIDTTVQEEEASMRMEMTFSNFDESVSIELPAAAQNATEMQGGMGQGVPTGGQQASG